MKTIGLLGGMTCESTVPYYRIINRCINERLGGQHSAKLWMYSVDFEEIESLQRAGDWEQAGAILAEAAAGLERAGADLLVLCTNTMHKVAPAIEARVSIPLLHIADATAAAIKAQGLARIALLGTRYTMEQDFYRARLERRHGLEVLVPPAEDREEVHRVIFEELSFGRILESSRAAYRRIISDLAERGAQGVILGCTEIGLLVRPEDSPVPVFDTTELHARAAALSALDS
jgi:aspartate racemase